MFDIAELNKTYDNAYLIMSWRCLRAPEWTGDQDGGVI
jgi:hypothetical protein